MKEIVLIRKAQRGDAQALNSLFVQHYAQVYKTLFRMTHNREQAEDLTQDSFVMAMRHIRKFRGDAKFSTWIHRIAVNTYLMSARKGKLSTVDILKATEPFLVSHVPNPEQQLLSTEIMELVEGLAPGYSAVFKFKVVYGLEHQEIAAKLGCSVGNSKSQFHKAKEKLQRLV